MWQIHDNFNKEPNKYDKNIYRFRIYIERTVKSDYLTQKYHFVNDVILETHQFFIFLAFKKKPCYFEKCCFDPQEVGTQKECDRLSCDGKYTEFTLFFH